MMRPCSQWLKQMPRHGLVFLLSSILFIHDLPAIDEEKLITRRIQAHLTIQNYATAVDEVLDALNRFPQSLSLREQYILALAKLGDEKKLLKAWDDLIHLFPNQIQNRPLIEAVAWGILEKASQSSSIVMREMALLAAFFSQDAKGVEILRQGMLDSNYAVRAIAVKLASHFRDHDLIEQVKRLFDEERVWSVRKQVIKAIGKMRIVSLRGALETLIASEESLSTEKELAIASLLDLVDSINRFEIEKLASSNRAGLRQLASEAIAYFQSSRDVDQLFLLVKDSHPNVRLAALQALGQLRPVGEMEKVKSLAWQCVQDRDHKVALSAIWLLTLYAPEEGQRLFDKFLFDRRREVRLLAAAALGATGKYGLSKTLDQFRRNPDELVKLNLALGLIGQRHASQEAAEYLKEILMTKKEKLFKGEVGVFRPIIHQNIKKASEEISSSTELDYPLLHLELLNLLAILKISDVHQVIRQYLSERSWEISATAAILLLTEGDESTIDTVQQLLKDPQRRIRLHAALILSLWSREENAIQILEEGYVTSDWELKSRILEGIGRIGSTRSIPFLIQCLNEPSQTLRLIASMALIQCLNH